MKRIFTILFFCCLTVAFLNAQTVELPAGHVRGICPEGWHIPSDAEWTELTNYLGSAYDETNERYLYRCNQSDATSIAKALASEMASETGWHIYSGECYPGDQSTKPNNASGFGAVPAGWFGIDFFDARYSTYFWSATQGSVNNAYTRDLYNNYSYVDSYSDLKNNGNSVRCLRD